ncbi:PIN/TRAM domain-containing protein [Poriferisphaera sp. WC338]|uniref:PIN/TRAM domain-containing protein n=1 Tax=Poriferisphaera sp. WC338 TaxID=3425129 RepID=UPI003D818A78
MVLQILRGALLLIATAVAALYLLSNQWQAGVTMTTFMVIMGGSVGITALVILIDSQIKHKKLSAVSGIFLGLIAGLLAAYAMSFVVDLIGVLTAPEISTSMPEISRSSVIYLNLNPEDKLLLDNAWDTFNAEVIRRDAYMELLEGVKVLIGLIAIYLSISMVLQTKDDFRFVIPYVEFTKQIRGNRPTLVDSSVIIDGRILDIIDTRIMQGTLVVPRFILNELQLIADSADKLKRARGRRGLDVLKQLQDSHIVEVHIEDRDAEGGTVDQKLIALAQDMQGRVMTNDYNLNKIAQLRGVDVININDLSKAMRPVVLPGEHMTVKIVKPGEGQSQGVGYLDDGTMVVVENGKHHVNESCDIVVTSTLQTSAGRMIFGRFAHLDDDEEHDGELVAATASADSSTETSTPVTSVAKPKQSPPAPSVPRSSSTHNTPSKASRRNPRRH